MRSGSRGPVMRAGLPKDPYIYKKPIILSLFKINTLTCPLKTYVRLHNLISMNIFFTIKDHSFSL